MAVIIRLRSHGESVEMMGTVKRYSRVSASRRDPVTGEVEFVCTPFMEETAFRVLIERIYSEDVERIYTEED